MFRIAVCDDEQSERRLLGRYVEEWAAQKGDKAAVRRFDSAESFLFSWEDDKDYRAVLLDIEMGSMNGVELAAKIRETDGEIPILFVTGYAEHMQCGYDVKALHYLLKPVSREKLFSVLDRLPAGGRDTGKIFLPTDEGSVSLPFRDIWYAEADGHRCVLHARGEAYALKESIGNLEKRLEAYPRIVKCHRCYLVNLEHAAAVRKEELVLDDGRRLPLSRNCRRAVNDAFIRCYCKR